MYTRAFLLKTAYIFSLFSSLYVLVLNIKYNFHLHQVKVDVRPSPLPKVPDFRDSIPSTKNNQKKNQIKVLLQGRFDAYKGHITHQAFGVV